MYDKRIKIFIIVSVLFLLICVLRLVQMQLLPDSSLQNEIEQLKHQRGLSRQLKTIRGQILDRNGEILAVDDPRFELHISYKLSRFWDERVRQAKLREATNENKANPSLFEIRQELQEKLEVLQQIIDKCTYFGLQRTDIEDRIKSINDRIWNLRTFVAWVRNGPDPNLLEKYNHKINSVPLSQAISSFEKKFPIDEDRLVRISKVNDIAEMDTTEPLLELRTDDDIFTAQVEFMDVNDIQILPRAQRHYPHGSVAAQTIGWVGPATQPDDKELFEGDKLASYLEDELCGREDGVEYVCEAILRGRRGQLVYDIDRELISRTETQFGKDVQLTLDIELQQRIEDYLANYPHDPQCGPGMAAVVIDVATGDILALVSMPVFDLNRARYDYGTLVSDPNKPLINRAINKQYPPGSVVKPLILIAALESGKVTADEIINCPAEDAPTGWPNCWIYNRNKIGHDSSWQNFARNAIKGSCNIYFSRVADRIDPLVLQQWLFKFGYSQEILDTRLLILDTHNENRVSSIQHREFRQAPGQISSAPPKGTISHFEQVLPLDKIERKLFGMGQGNLRATPLQVANAMAAIARGGLYKQPRLLGPSVIASEAKQSQINMEKVRVSSIEHRASSIDLGISPQTLDVIYDGMSAVVNEPGGTAHKEFAPVLGSFAEQDVKIYGKTGSTEAPEVAWFAGFAWQPQAQLGDGFTPGEGRTIAIAVVVEGGQRGSADAAPLARDIIWLCIEEGYIGATTDYTEEESATN